jgi:hypothetical protein
MARLFFAFALLCLSAATANAQILFLPYYIPNVLPEAEIGDYSKVHSVAVVSALGPTMTLTPEGSLSPPRSMNITAWRLDDAVSNLIAGYLSGRFETKEISYDRATLSKIPNSALNDSRGALRAYVRALSNEGIDAFVIVRPDQESYTPGLPGLVLQTFYRTRPIEWANFEIDIVDAHSYETLGKAYSRIQFRVGGKPQFAAVYGSRNLASNKFDFDDRQIAELRRDMTSLASWSVLETLRALHLGIALPEVGEREITDIPPETDPFGKVRAVTIISVIGDQLELKHRSAGRFNNSDKTAPIGDWLLDDYVLRTARATLSQRFNIVETTANLSALEKIRLIGTDNKVRTSFPELPQRDDIDAYILFVKYPTTFFENAFYKDVAAGVGILDDNRMIHTTQIYAYFAVLIVDAWTRELIREAIAVTSPRYSDPQTKIVDSSLWAADAQALSPKREPVLQLFKDVLADSVDETLLRIGLTGRLISDLPPTASRGDRE